MQGGNDGSKPRAPTPMVALLTPDGGFRETVTVDAEPEARATAESAAATALKRGGVP